MTLSLPPLGKDEIGKLSHSFKVMRESIKTNEDALILAAHEAAIAERLLQENQEHLLDEHAAAVQALAEIETVNEQLKQTHNEISHLRSALDEHAIVSIADTEGNMTFINDKFCKISGYTTDELLGKNHRMLKSNFHASEYYKALRDTVSKGKIWHGDMCSTAKDGTQYWVDATIVPFLDDNDKPYKYVAISTDITDQINTLERLKENTAEINQAHADLKKSHQQVITVRKTGIRWPTRCWYSSRDQYTGSIYRR